MDRTVARLNIEHLKRKLAEESDEAKRSILQQILDEEYEKLRRAEEQDPKGRGKTGGD